MSFKSSKGHKFTSDLSLISLFSFYQKNNINMLYIHIYFYKNKIKFMILLTLFQKLLLICYP